MQILKNILLGIIALILFLIIIGYLFISPKHSFERSIVIDANKEVVFNFLNDFNNWKSFGPWYEMDTTQTNTISGTMGEDGYTYEWASNNKDVGHGSMSRVLTSPNDSLINELYFQEMDTRALDKWILEEDANGTKVRWIYMGDAGSNIAIRYFSLFMENMMSPFLDKGLEKLKTTIETKSAQMPVATSDSDTTATS